MVKSFIDAYTEAPDEIKIFLYSDDFYSFLDECIKKFEIKDTVSFTHLLQDLALKIIGETENLKEIIKSRLNLDDENANQLAFHIRTKFVPLFEKLWKKEVPIERQEVRLKTEAPKEVVDLIQKKKEQSPLKVLNLKKVIPPKKEIPIKEEPAIDLRNLQPIKTAVPKATVDIKQSISWEPPKPKGASSANIVIIRKEQEKKEGNENIIDLSNL